MTTATAAIQTGPSFPTHSRPLELLRDLCVVALCAALVGGFLAQVWSAPQAPVEAAAAAPGVVQSRS
jgi:hypothetical protein